MSHLSCKNCKRGSVWNESVSDSHTPTPCPYWSGLVTLVKWLNWCVWHTRLVFQVNWSLQLKSYYAKLPFCSLCNRPQELCTTLAAAWCTAHWLDVMARCATVLRHEGCNCLCGMWWIHASQSIQPNSRCMPYDVFILVHSVQFSIQSEETASRSWEKYRNEGEED